MVANGETVYIGMGANLGDAVNTIVSARKRLFDLDFVINSKSSSLYATSPVGYDKQPDFINCVVSLEITAPVRQLFTEMQCIEESYGRVRNPDLQDGPRTLDLDLLLAGNQVINDSDLIVPHPRMKHRLFVLLPLQELTVDLARRYASDSELEFSGQEIYRLCL